MMTSPVFRGNLKKEPWVRSPAHRTCSTWLAEQQVSLAFTTYRRQTVPSGSHPEADRRFRCTFNWAWALGRWSDPLVEHALPTGVLRTCSGLANSPGTRSALCAEVGNTTGDIDIHDVPYDKPAARSSCHEL
jgi:hypothetical protein